MKNCLIASVYFEDPKVPSMNMHWLKLQKLFIKKYTSNYDFVVYPNNLHGLGFLKEVTLVGNNPKTLKSEVIADKQISEGIDKKTTSEEKTVVEKESTLRHLQSHGTALEFLIKYFIEKKNEYSCFCILDSDCFPIRRRWIKFLKYVLKHNNLKFAAISRYENGEMFPHPSGIFILSEYVDENLFKFPASSVVAEQPKVTNLLFSDKFPVITDTGSANSFWQDGKFVGYPLVRSNVINLHPLLSGIYGDIFYHHGRGGRVRIKNFRFRSKDYWPLHSKFLIEQDEYMLFSMLVSQPEKFIDKLRGIELLREVYELKKQAIFDIGLN
jgi:hypothetical protein